MSMLQVGVIGVLGVLFAVQFKSGKSEYAVYISVAVSLLLFGCMLERLRDAVDSLGRIGNYIKVDQRFFGTMIKMIGITYLAEFSSGICKDAGYQSIASQIEIFSKLTILAMGLPILQTLLEVMLSHSEVPSDIVRFPRSRLKYLPGLNLQMFPGNGYERSEFSVHFPPDRSSYFFQADHPH